MKIKKIISKVLHIFGLLQYKNIKTSHGFFCIVVKVIIKKH